MHKGISALRERRARLAKSNKGFTLIELLVVVVILGVLIAIAIPLYLNYRKGANDAASQSDLRNALSVFEVCNTDNGAYPASFVLDATAAAKATTSPVPCIGQTINASAGTKLTYSQSAAVVGVGAAAAGVSYVVYDYNANGTTSRFYCYDSKVGGSVKSQSAAGSATGC